MNKYYIIANCLLFGLFILGLLYNWAYRVEDGGSSWAFVISWAWNDQIVWVRDTPFCLAHLQFSVLLKVLKVKKNIW